MSIISLLAQIVRAQSQTFDKIPGFKISGGNTSINFRSKLMLYRSNMFSFHPMQQTQNLNIKNMKIQKSFDHIFRNSNTNFNTHVKLYSSIFQNCLRSPIYFNSDVVYPIVNNSVYKDKSQNNPYYNRNATNAAFDITKCSFINCSTVTSTLGNETGRPQPTESHSGGAIFSNNPVSFNIILCNFSDCVAQIYGGAISIFTSNDTTITECTFINCTASFGAAIAFRECENTTLTHCLFSDSRILIQNYADALSVVCFQRSKDALFDHCSFYHSVSYNPNNNNPDFQYAAEIYAADSLADSTITINNSCFENVTSPGLEHTAIVTYGITKVVILNSNSELVTDSDGNMTLIGAFNKTVPQNCGIFYRTPTKIPSASLAPTPDPTPEPTPDPTPGQSLAPTIPQSIAPTPQPSPTPNELPPPTEDPAAIRERNNKIIMGVCIPIGIIILVIVIFFLVKCALKDRRNAFDPDADEDEELAFPGANNVEDEADIIDEGDEDL